MSVHGENNLNEDLLLTESDNEIVGNLIVTELSETLGAENFNAFLESEECEALMEAGRISKKTVVRMSKADDLERRTNQAAMNLAKQQNTSAWKDYQKAAKAMKKAKAQMIKQHGSKGAKIAKKAQKEFLKIPSLKATVQKFRKAK